MKTHLHRSLMPIRWPDHGKVIYVTRNPYDTCISLWHEFRKSNRIPDDFDRYVENFISGDVTPYDPYGENILSWHSFQHPNLLKIGYEETRRGTRSVVNRIAQFLEQPVAPGQIDEILTKMSFDDDEIGEWRTALSKEQQGRIHEIYVRPLQDAGVPIETDYFELKNPPGR
jgi:hypothetical protein